MTNRSPAGVTARRATVPRIEWCRVSPLVLVLLILLAVTLVQAAIWIPLGFKFKRDADAFQKKLEAEIAASGEKILRGPEKGIYRGCTAASFGGVRGNGLIWLTSQRLIFRKLTGGTIHVPLGTVKGSHEAKSFLGSVSGNRMHFVVDTNDGAEIAFYVADNAAWARDLAAARVT